MSREGVEALYVGAVPEIELEVFGVVLDVDEIIHEVGECTWLEDVSWSVTLPTHCMEKSSI
jgi:hypothetical protein